MSVSAARLERSSPVQHIPSGAIRSARVGASPEPIQHQQSSGIASLPGHTKVALSPPRVRGDGQSQPQPQSQQQPSRRSPVRRVVLAGEQPYWQYSGYASPAPPEPEPEDAQWDQFYSVLHKRPYCTPAALSSCASVSCTKAATD